MLATMPLRCSVVVTRSGSAVAGFAVSVAFFKICRLCNGRSDSVSPIPPVINYPYGGFRAWLHYKRIAGAIGADEEPGEETKDASGKICAFCYRAFMLSSLRITHRCAAAYIAWNNAADTMARHGAFMRALKRVISSVKNRDGRVQFGPALSPTAMPTPPYSRACQS